MADKKKFILACAMFLPFMVGASHVFAADEADMVQRVDRLERIVKGQGLISLLSRVEELQSEIQRLNGDNELLRHDLSTLRQQQRQLYMDLDERLQAQQAKAVTPSVELVLDETKITADETGELDASTPDNIDDLAAPELPDHGEPDYQSALQVLRSGQYEQAIDRFAGFIDAYPQSDYLPNAYYWQGEAHYVLRHFKQAMLSFKTVIDRFPDSNKAADALLKSGFSQYELDQVTEAKTILNDVINNYPDTPAARLAKVRLALIKQEAR